MVLETVSCNTVTGRHFVAQHSCLVPPIICSCWTLTITELPDATTPRRYTDCQYTARTKMTPPMLNPLKSPIFILQEYVTDSPTRLQVYSPRSKRSCYNFSVSYSNFGTSQRLFPLLNAQETTWMMDCSISAFDVPSGRMLFGVHQTSKHDRWYILLPGETLDLPAVRVEKRFSWSKTKLDVYVGGLLLCVRAQSHWKPRTNVYLGSENMGFCIMTIKGDVADIAQGVDASLVGPYTDEFLDESIC